MADTHTASQQRASAYAVVFGAPSADIKFSGGSAVGYVINSFDLQATAEQVMTTDEEGKVVNITTFNFGKEVTLEVVFSGSSVANAKTASSILLPGIQVAVVDATNINSFTDADFSAASTGIGYSLKSWQKRSASGQKMTGTIVLQQFAGIGTSAAAYAATTS